MNMKKNINSGFTLAEVMVSMLLMSMFFLATTKVMTHKPKPELQESPHGFFECYYDKDGVLMQHKSNSNLETEPEKAKKDGCHFKPASGTVFTNVYYIYLAQEGSEPKYDKFRYLNTNEVQFNMERVIRPETFLSETNVEPVILEGESFLSYLRSIHTNSIIYKNWEEGKKPMYPGVVFIAW